MAGEPKLLRCAIYTRKSTEHGLELEFNSLDAQRDACEAYIKSQASQGWRALPQHYDDPAYSGGNLDRPALKKLLADIEARKIDVVVVYKIDRLTRSLADFAKLVEAFDARSISFVAVTQQFNTTTSMGRLTLNVLLVLCPVRAGTVVRACQGQDRGQPAQGQMDRRHRPARLRRQETRSSSSTRPRPKPSAPSSSLYLELRSFSKLVADLDRRGIVTKRRSTKVTKYKGGIPFTYGPLAYFLKNRIYLGEIHHGGKWFEGEHEAIVDRATFDGVQQLLATKTNGRKAKRSESGALLMGKLCDDRGNRMSPSFSSKNGVRYRFYVSSALLRGRKAASGSVTRVSAQAIEQVIVQTLRVQHPDLQANDAELVDRHLLRAQLGDGEINLALLQPESLQETSPARGRSPNSPDREIRIPWVRPGNSSPTFRQNGTNGSDQLDQKLVQAVVRAHRWANALANADFASIEELAS